MCSSDLESAAASPIAPNLSQPLGTCGLGHSCLAPAPASGCHSRPSDPLPGTGGGGFIGCCLQGGMGLTAEPLLLCAGMKREAGEGEEQAGWGARGQILHPCKPDWGQSYPGFPSRPQWMRVKPPKAC